MTLFAYKSIDTHGKIIRGLQDSPNLFELETRLKRQRLDLISAKETRRNSPQRHTIKRAELITFFFNLDQFSRAGVPLLDCLNDLRDSMDEAIFHDIIANLIVLIEHGNSLSQAMAQHPNAFDNVTVSLIHAGETSGQLPDIFRHLSDAFKWQDEMATQTKNILIYPAFIGMVILGVTFFLMIYLVPQLAIFIKSNGQNMPWQTQLLLSTSEIVVHDWQFILASPLLFYVAIKSAIKINPGWQYHLDRVKLNTWPTGNVLRKIILARVAHTFAMMYGAGISILDCLSHTCALANNQVIAQSLEQVKREIEAGNNLTQSFQNVGIFPPLIIRMLKVGEATGQLDAALLNVSYFYDRDVKDAIKKAQLLIEPTMTLIMGALLGWIMLAVLSPIYDIISKINM